LFSKFDSIQTDKEGLFSATPECVAQYVASRVESKQKVVWDAFAGVGGNCCHFGSFERVIATDLSSSRLQMCQHNCEIVYGVTGIEFAVGDFMVLCQTLRADVVILSPPWGGPQYQDVSDPAAMLLDNIISVPCSGVELLQQGIRAAKPGGVIVYMLPKNVNNESVMKAGEKLSLGVMEVEDVYVDGVCKMTLAFYRLSQ
jgi:trimethylguanosine synthase